MAKKGREEREREERKKERARESKREIERGRQRVRESKRETKRGERPTSSYSSSDSSLSLYSTFSRSLYPPPAPAHSYTH